MKDVLGNTLNIGDRIVYTYSGYEELCSGYVHSFTPKMVRVCNRAGEIKGRKTSNQVVLYRE